MTHSWKYTTTLELDLDRCGLEYGGAPCTAGTEVHTGTSQAGATGNSIVLAAGASAVDGFYDGDAIALADGRRAVIVDYDGTTKRATVDRPWPINAVKQSDALDQSPWTVTLGASVAADQVKAPDGTLTGDRIAGGIDPDAVVYQDLGLGAGATRRTQCYLEAGSSLSTRLGIFEVSVGFQGVLTLAWSADGTPSLVSSAGADNIRIRRAQFGWWFIGFESTWGASTSHRITIEPDRDGQDRFCHAWRAQVALSTEGLEPIATAAAGVSLPNSIAYRVIEAGGECYNTITTCQDKANFLKTLETWSFADSGASLPVGPEIRPYITAKNFASTEIDLEKGLARRNTATLDLQDEPAVDGLAADPYQSTRPAPAAGGWLARFLARNKTAVGRDARIGQAYSETAWDWSAFRYEHYIIENLAGPDSRGKVRVTLKDPIKLTDRRKIPEPSSGKLAADLGAADLSCELVAGEGVGYPAGGGYVRINREVIQYTSRSGDTLSWLSTAFRGTWGTEAKAHNDGAGVQLCRAWIDTPVTTVLRDMLEESGLETALIDTAGFTQEELDWYGQAFNVTANITAPEQSSKLIADLLVLMAAFMWWSPHEQLVKVKAFAPVPPNQPAVPLLDDAGGFVMDSTGLKPRDDLRSTLRALYYGLVSPVVDRKEQANYERARIVIDSDAESANEYDDRRIVTQFSRWWADNDVAAFSLISRAAAYYRDAPIRFDARLNAKDIEITEGQLVDIEMGQYVDFAGAPQRLRALVTRHKDLDGEFEIILRSTGFARRYGFIGPAGAGDYPNDSEYAHIAADVTGFSDGTGPYLIF